MASPAERYAAARRSRLGARLQEFSDAYAFGLDPFQVEACQALDKGGGVLVAAPTGAGKTVVGEYAVHLALAAGTKCFYTTPIKALSNQKHADLVARHGAANVGLLTGDNAVNGDAPVVVMTTEVLRNMLYAGSPALRGLSHVVMDEVHYLSDRMRGAVWEEVIIHLPPSVSLVSLSATVSNVEEFADWLTTVRGETTIVVEEHRPVPLWQHVLAGNRIYDLFVDDAHADVNPALLRLARDEARWDNHRQRKPRSAGGAYTASRAEVIDRLDHEGLLPAITFIFSRAGCAAAVEQCLRAGLRLTSDEERFEVRRIVEQATADIPTGDLGVLDYYAWLDGLERGIAAHHAGMLPRFKEVVEDLFSKGLVKAVFATETLALGINMPARSVVLERLVKWNGETHADVTPGEYTQLTGRAGRRGIDVEGHAVVLWSQGFDPRHVAGLASTRTYPLRSSFRPSYNMAVNLVATVGADRARELLASSFAQFQADRSVVGVARQVKRNEAALAGYEEAMTCHLGDMGEYAGLRRAIKAREAHLARSGAAQRRSSAAESLGSLRPGDVIHVPAGRRSGLAVVLDPGTGVTDGPRPVVLTIDRQVKRLSVVDFPTPVQPLGTLRIPKGFNARSPHARRDLVSTLRAKGFAESAGRPAKQRSAAADDQELARLRTALRAHPCHGCADREDHARWAQRHAQLRADTQSLTDRMAGRTGSIARTFDQVRSVLEELGYLDAAGVTDAGRRLARVYAEADLLVVECLRRGTWDHLDAPGLAACVSALVFESRGNDDDTGQAPPAPVRQALDDVTDVWHDLREVEERHRLSFLPEPDSGFAWAAHRWASGATLEQVLRGADLTAGDFVRWCKQLIDLLGQLEDAAPEGSPVRARAREAINGLRRGVVAYTGVV